MDFPLLLNFLSLGWGHELANAHGVLLNKLFNSLSHGESLRAELANIAAVTNVLFMSLR